MQSTSRSTPAVRQAEGPLYLAEAGSCTHGCAADARAAGGRLGLVHSQTSDTPREIRVDQALARLRRMRKSVITTARLHQEATPRARAAMVTLTYREGAPWQPRHVSEFLKRARQWAARRGHALRGVWVMETTKRGKPHYHVLLWLPRGLSLPKPDKQGWWPHGMTRIEYVRKAVGYAAKYASKGADALPKGARCHGGFGLEEAARLHLRWWKLPEWLREQVTTASGLRRLPGVGWVDADTGETFRSPWEVHFREGAVWLRLKS